MGLLLRVSWIAFVARFVSLRVIGWVYGGGDLLAGVDDRICCVRVRWDRLFVVFMLGLVLCVMVGLLIGLFLLCWVDVYTLVKCLCFRLVGVCLRGVVGCGWFWDRRGLLFHVAVILYWLPVM